MPFKSEKQRRFMYAKHPQIARRWSQEEKAVTKRAPQPRYGGRGGVGRKIVDEDMPVDTVSKGWGADLGRAGKNAARKAKIRDNIEISRMMRGPDGPEIRRYEAEDLMDARSHRKSVNFVERFRYDPQTGSRRIARPGLKTSLPRQRSLTTEDKRYLGLPGGERGTGTRQGVGGRGGDRVDYQLTGNRRVRKAADHEARRQRRLGAGEAALLIGGGLSVQHGTRGIMRSTRAARNAARLAEKWKDKGTAAALRQGVTASRKDLGYVGGGTAGILGAGMIRQHAEGKRGRRWT